MSDYDKQLADFGRREMEDIQKGIADAFAMPQRIAKLEAINAQLLAACEELLACAWDGDPRRQADDPICLRAAAAIVAAKEANDD